MSAVQNLIIQQGETWTRQITWRTGTPATLVNLTGATAKCKIRTVPESLIVVAEPTVQLGGAAGTITLSLTAAQTADLIFKGGKTGTLSEDGSTFHNGILGVYDLTITLAGVAQIPLSGQILYVTQVSR